MDITINGNINFNGDNNFSNYTLLDNETTFKDLISQLKKNRSAQETAQTEEMEEAPLTRTLKRPGAVQLRTQCDRIAMIPVGAGCCEVFSNGYAVFDNGDRKTVVWAPSCGTRTYRFTKLTSKELEYQRDKETLDEEMLGDLPWYYPIIMAGEDRIEQNLAHLRSIGNMSDIDAAEESQGEEIFCWCCGTATVNPEDTYIQKEAEAERRAVLTDKQREVYDMYYVDNLTQCEIARELGISQKAVDYRLEGIEKKFRKFSDDTSKTGSGMPDKWEEYFSET